MTKEQILQDPRFRGVEPFPTRVWLASPTMHGDEQRWADDAIQTNWVSTVGRNIDEIEKEYGLDYLELPKLVNTTYENKNFYIIDDIYATGNTLRAIKDTVRSLNGNIIGEGVVLNIKELNNNTELFSLIDINEE